MKPLSVGFTVRWHAHDSWSELYVGIRRLVYEILPVDIASHRAEDSALCQLAVVGANSLMEVCLYKLLQSYTADATRGLSPPKLDKAGYADMVKYLESIVGKPMDYSAQPLISTEVLRLRRNATIHKTSALATGPMACSALFSAVEGCRHIYAHAGQPFPWEAYLVDTPLPVERWFSDVSVPS